MISIDNEQPNKEQRQIIENSVCLQCKKPFKKTDNVMFVQLDDHLIWWHIKKYPWQSSPCKYQSEEKPHRKKITNKELRKKYDFLFTPKLKRKVV